MLTESRYHFSFGNPVWPGLAKLVEELGELSQVLGKLMAYPNEQHPDGRDTRASLLEELADVMAAIGVFAELNITDEEMDLVITRAEAKADLFMAWNEGHDPLTEVSVDATLTP